jgi:hypothetical protein
MTQSILKELDRNLHHTKDNIDLVTYLMPPKVSMTTFLLSILNGFLPFIKLREKTSYYLFAVSTQSKRAYYLHVGEKAGELFKMKTYNLDGISDLKVDSNPQKYAHKISFVHEGSEEKIHLLEYPISIDWSDEQRQAFSPMAKEILAQISQHATSKAA